MACGFAEPYTACEAGEGFEPTCGFENPEDLVLLAGGEWLLMAEMAPMGRSEGDPGRLLAWRPGDDTRRVLHPLDGADAPDAEVGDAECPGPPLADRFAPHGIDLSPDGSRLAVVNHGGREAVELFALGADGEGPTLSWLGCLLLPGESFGNDLVFLPDGSLVVANMLPRDPGFTDNVRLLMGGDTGELIRWTDGAGWSEVAGSRAPTPNGVEVSADGSTLYFTAWAARRLVAVPVDGGEPRSVDLGIRGDNLSWDSSGQLLITGQDTGMSELVGCTSRKEGTCPIAFEVLRMDPETLEVTRLFSHDGRSVFGAASVALEAPGGWWLGSFGSDRIAWRPAP